MSAEANTDLIERYFETIWSNGELDRGPEFVAADVIVHAAPIQGIPEGRDGPLAIVSTFRAAVPDLRLRNTVIVAHGDRQQIGLAPAPGEAPPPQPVAEATTT
jgi:hypothetical protein